MTPEEELELLRLRARARARQQGASQPGASRPQQRRVGQVEDVGRSLVTGLERAPGLVLGMTRDLSDLGDVAIRGGMNLAARVAGRDPLPREQQDAVVRTITGARDVFETQALGPAGIALNASRRTPSSTEINRVIDSAIPGEQHEPQTVAGEYARTFGEFAPAAAFPGSLAARTARVAVPAAGSETGGQIGRPFGPEAETAGRIIGGVGGGVVAEAGIMANQARNVRRTAPTSDAAALETEFAPLTRGERSANPAQRLEEADIRMGVGSDRAQNIMRTFDGRRARQARDNAMRIVSRGQEPISQDVGEAGIILGDELRTQRQALRARAQRQYDTAFNMARAEPIPQGLNDLPSGRIAAVADEYLIEIPGPARQAIQTLERQINEGGATQANVERARQALNRELGAAVNTRNDAAEFAYARIIESLDDWQAGIMRAPEARRAMQEARGIYAESAQLFGRQGRTELSTGQMGRMDPGGRAIDRTINTDLTGEQIIDSIVGAGRRPSQQALGAVRRIKELGTETVATSGQRAGGGVRAPGRRRRGGRTVGQARFMADDPNAPGGTQLPTNELQALREGLWHRVLSPLDDYLVRAEASGAREAGLLPAQKMVSQLDNALNRSGREIMQILYTERELAAMQRLLQYFQRIVPPPGAAYSGTAQGLRRMIGRAFDASLQLIPGLGPALRESAERMGSINTARRATAAPPPPRAASAAALADQRIPEYPIVAGGIGARFEQPEEPRRGIGAPPYE